MNDPNLILGRLMALVLVPLFLLFPLVFTFFFRSRAQSEAERAMVAFRQLVLVLATGIAFAIWLGTLLAGINLRNEAMTFFAQFCWVFFFPLWFGLAMPLVALKNPAFAGKLPENPAKVRAASLVNRSRKNPIGIFHYGLLVVSLGAIMVVLLARGLLYPFDDESERFRWILLCAVHAGQFLTVGLIVPWGLQLVLCESEPMDAQGNPELVSMYDNFRNAKIQNLFWLLGVVAPVFNGAVFCLMVWFWNQGQLLTWVAAIGGSLIGIGGAWTGMSLGLRRAQIAEFKSKLDSGELMGEPGK